MMSTDLALSTPLGPAGRMWLRNAVSNRTLSALDQHMVHGVAGARLTQGKTPVLAPVCAALEPVFGHVWPVRVVAFDKQGDHNWSVPWHRDSVIAVEARADHPDFWQLVVQGRVVALPPARGCAA